MVRVCGIVRRLGYANLPRHTLLADATGHHLSANLYHEVVNALATQKVGNNIAAITFGNGATVEHGAWVGLLYAAVFHAHLVKAHERAQAVYGVLGGHGSVLEAEAPGVDERRNRYVEGTVGVF